MANPMFCTIHSQPMSWHESKTKFNEDGSPKTYASHLTVDGKICFGSPPKVGKTDNGNYPSQKSFEKSVDDKPDWDSIAEGKIRSLFLQAHIQKNGLVGLTAQEDAILDALVERAMGDSRKV